MIENPIDWFDKCSVYALPNAHEILFGDLFLLQSDAPGAVQHAYREYLHLLKKVYVNTSVLTAENGEFTGINDDLDAKGKEQAALALKLIECGIYPSGLTNRQA